MMMTDTGLLDLFDGGGEETKGMQRTRLPSYFPEFDCPLLGGDLSPPDHSIFEDHNFMFNADYNANCVGESLIDHLDVPPFDQFDDVLNLDSLIGAGVSELKKESPERYTAATPAIEQKDPFLSSSGLLDSAEIVFETVPNDLLDTSLPPSSVVKCVSDGVVWPTKPKMRDVKTSHRSSKVTPAVAASQCGSASKNELVVVVNGKLMTIPQKPCSVISAGVGVGVLEAGDMCSPLDKCEGPSKRQQQKHHLSLLTKSQSQPPSRASSPNPARSMLTPPNGRSLLKSSVLRQNQLHKQASLLAQATAVDSGRPAKRLKCTRGEEPEFASVPQAKTMPVLSFQQSATAGETVSPMSSKLKIGPKAIVTPHLGVTPKSTSLKQNKEIIPASGIPASVVNPISVQIPSASTQSAPCSPMNSEKIKQALPPELIEGIKAACMNRHSSVIRVQVSPRQSDAASALRHMTICRLTGQSSSQEVAKAPSPDHDYCSPSTSQPTSPKPDHFINKLPEYVVGMVKQEPQDSGKFDETVINQLEKVEEVECTVKQEVYDEAEVVVKTEPDDVFETSVGKTDLEDGTLDLDIFGIASGGMHVNENQTKITSESCQSSVAGDNIEELCNALDEAVDKLPPYVCDLARREPENEHEASCPPKKAKKKLKLQEYRERMERLRSADSSRCTSPAVSERSESCPSACAVSPTCLSAVSNPCVSATQADTKGQDQKESSESALPLQYQKTRSKRKGSEDKRRRKSRSVSRDRRTRNFWSRSPSQSRSRSRSCSRSRSRSRSKSLSNSSSYQSFNRSSVSRSRSRSPGRPRRPSDRRRHRHSRRRRSNENRRYRSRSPHSSRGGGWNRWEMQRNLHVGYYSKQTPQWSRQRREEHNKGVNERRIVFVGKISAEMTTAQLRTMFEPFGTVTDVSLHFREDRDNYGFVTYERADEAYRALERAPKLYPEYDISFGGRRAFCKSEYSDLDSTVNNVAATATRLDCRQNAMDYSKLLHEALSDMKYKKRR